MEPATKGDVDRLGAIVESIALTIQDQTSAIRALIDVTPRERPSDTIGGKAEIHINAGGIATIIACCLSVLCVALLFQQSRIQNQMDAEQNDDIREQRAENRRINDYLSSLYRQYPELRPENLKKRNP